MNRPSPAFTHTAWKHLRHTGFFLLPLLLTGLAGTLRAQSPVAPATGEPVELTVLRQRYQSLLADAGKPSRENWLAGLESLQSARAAAGDYGGALRVGEKIKALRDVRQTAAADAPYTLKLEMNAAKLGPGSEYVDSAKQTVRVKRAGMALEWDVNNAPTGIYEVRLTYGAPGAAPADADRAEEVRPIPGQPAANELPRMEPRPDEAGGVVEFLRVTNLNGGGSSFQHLIRPTGGWAAFRTVKIGSISVDSHLARFSMRVLSAQALGVMDLRSVELMRTGESPWTGVNAAESPDRKELTRLREVYQKQFAELTKSLRAKFLKNLTDLEPVLSRNKDTDGLALVRQEKLNLENGAAGVRSDTGEFKLPVNDSLTVTIRGEARLTSQKDYLIRLRPPASCEIIWKLTRLGIPSGTYQVEIACRQTAETGGTASLFSMGAGSSPDPALSFVVGPGKGASAILKPGNITIGKGSDHLSLRVDTLLRNEGSLCDLQYLRLRRVSDP